MRGFISIIIMLVIVGLMVGGFYLYLQKQNPNAPETAKPSPQVYFSADRLEQGDTLLIRIENEPAVSEVSGELASTKIGFLKLGDNGVWAGIAGIDARKTPGKYDLVVDLPNEEQLKKGVEIVERKFPTTELFVNKELKEKGYTPSKIVKNITTEENVILKEILGIYTPEAYFNEPFIYPLEKIKIVGDFGNIRKSGDSGAQHLGVDLNASMGTKVYAVNDGFVRLAQEFSTYGKTLIINHGLGIYSLYLHLDEFKTSNGEKIKRGDTIGYSGNTGYSIAPHLHFSVKVNGSSVDPIKFIETVEKVWKTTVIYGE